MKQRVYIETTIVSYLAARLSRDIIQATHQKISWDWWNARRMDFNLYASQVVVQEVSAGDPDAARRRLEFMEGVPLLEVNDAVVALAGALIKEGALPAKAGDDALHLALSSVHGMDYLLTWNCRHLANAEMSGTRNSIICGHRFVPPVICTPEELLGE